MTFEVALEKYMHCNEYKSLVDTFKLFYEAGMEEGMINTNAEPTLLRVELAHLKAKDSKMRFGEIKK